MPRQREDMLVGMEVGCFVFTMIKVWKAMKAWV